MRLCVLAAALCLSFAASAADRDYGSASVERVTSIYDGDTFRVDIAGWPSLIGSRVPIRLAGADTPEIRAHCAREKRLARQAKQFTVSALRSGHNIQLRHMRRGKYFRIVAQVVIDGQRLAPRLIEAGLANPYSGGHKAGWCP
ncbi:thermonuclease family protein [Salinisphaera sp. SPP-AMP-43]|uniref:thermonuclease family protein n=1 Tax=Salinisphaera sp. SPP-AMP-43 TaxID=3121288 RepID=UPI003C6DCEC5